MKLILKKISDNIFYQKIIIFVLIVSISIITWYNSFYIQFLNDDYQIISIHNPKNFIDCFKPFVTTDILGSYWRPFVNTLHSLTIYFFGFEPIVFHLSNLLIYTTSVYLFALMLLKLNFNFLTTIISSILFLLLPNHEIVVAWLSGRNETLMLFFILLSTIILLNHKISKKAEILYYFSFFAAIHTKELAYISILLPILILIYKANFKNFHIDKIHLRIFIISLFIVLVSIIYRLAFIGSNPAESSHFNKIDISIISVNFLKAIPLSFISPETAEIIYYLLKDNNFIPMLLIFVTVIILVLIKALPKLKVNINSKNALFGAIWFIIFIIPPLPNMMRWYVLTASIGLFIIISTIIENLTSVINFKNLIPAFLIFILISSVLIFMNNSKMRDWIEASNKTQIAYSSLKKYNLTQYENIYLWGLPDKINRVNAMKLGVEHSVNYILNGSYNLIAPLKIEMYNKTEIKFNIKGDTLELIAKNGRYIPFLAPSKFIIEKESFLVNDNFYNLNINTINDSGKIQSIAQINNLIQESNTAHFYFDGNIFKKIY